MRPSHFFQMVANLENSVVTVPSNYIICKTLEWPVKMWLIDSCRWSHVYLFLLFYVLMFALVEPGVSVCSWIGILYLGCCAEFYGWTSEIVKVLKWNVFHFSTFRLSISPAGAAQVFPKQRDFVYFPQWTTVKQLSNLAFSTEWDTMTY